MPSLIRPIRELELARKRLFLRLDFNVPLSEPDESGVRKVEDDTRIVEAIPTIRYAMEQGAKIVIASHLGRPKGKDPALSLLPIAAHLAELLNEDVTLAEDCIGEGIELMAANLRQGQILLLENVRYHPEEEKNDKDFAFELSKLAEVFVMDAFGAAHRAHATTHALPSLMSQKGMGLLVEKEIRNLDRLLHRPAKPFHLVLGGAKVSDKIQTIRHLLRDIDGMVVGGAMAYAFQAAKKLTVPENAKQPSKEDVAAADEILREAAKKELPILLPSDSVESFDIGPQTVERFLDFLGNAKSIFWNGPMGWFEKPPYDAGTNALAEGLASMPSYKVIGGGDTVSAVKKGGFEKGFDHLSTGGGAALEYLEGKGLPGLEILHSSSPRRDLIT